MYKGIILLALAAGFLMQGDTLAERGYPEDELADVSIQAYDSLGNPASGIQVYWGDNAAEYEGFEETDPQGRIVLRGLRSESWREYGFYTFIDGYYVQGNLHGVSAGGSRAVELRPETENGQDITIDFIGNSAPGEGGKLTFQIEISGCGAGDSSYAEVLAYDEKGNLLTGFCENPDQYAFDYDGYGVFPPWLGYGYDLGGLSAEQREWLLGNTGELCLGDLRDVNGFCSYPHHDDPMEGRKAKAHKPACPTGGLFRPHAGSISYINSVSIPESSKKIIVRAIGIDGSGNYKIEERTIERSSAMHEQDYPCIACGLALIIVLLAAAIGGAAAIASVSGRKRARGLIVRACGARRIQALP